MLRPEQVVAQKRIDLLFVLLRSVDLNIVEVHALLPEIEFGAQTAAVIA